MSLMEAAFLAPATGSRAPVAAPVAVLAPKATLAGAVLATASRSASAAAIAVGALTVLSAGRRRRVARAAAAAVEAAEDVPPPPPPFSPAAQIGATEPLGFFDPLGFTKVGDEAGFNKLRSSELKHGRVAMMASVGLLGQHFIKFPGFEKTPAGFAAMGTGEGVIGFVGIYIV